MDNIMKTDTELEQITRHLRDGDYPTVLKLLIQKVYGKELCEHLYVAPCRQCLAEVDSRILPNSEEL